MNDFRYFQFDAVSILIDDRGIDSLHEGPEITANEKSDPECLRVLSHLLSGGFVSMDLPRDTNCYSDAS